MNPNSSFSSFNETGGFSSFGAKTQQQSIDELLAVAKMHGGAIGQVADELTHPEKSILSTIGQGFKNTFTGFIDLISTGSYAVAGAIDPTKTVGEAISQKITPSEVLLGKADPNATTLRKTGDFLTRLAIDVITDPLTYVTFGAGSGLTGMRALSKVAVQDKRLSDVLNVASDVLPDTEKMSKIASEFGVTVEKGDTLETITSKARALTDKEVMVTKEGEDWLHLNIKAQADGLGDVSQWSTAKVADLAGKMGREQGMKGKELKAYIDDAKKSVEDFSIAKRDAAKVGQTIKAEDRVLKDMIDRTIGLEMTNDVLKKSATDAMGKLLAKHPQLMDTFLDKGGIKFLGSSIVSGARVAATMELIPGMKLIDHATAPTREMIAGLFDRTAKFKKEGMDADAINKVFNIASKSESERNRVLTDVPKIWKEFGLSPEEHELVAAAIQHGERPADGILARTISMMKGEDVVNMTDKEVNLVQAIRHVQGINEQAYNAKIAAGIRATHHENYFVNFKSEQTEVSSKISGSSMLSTKVDSGKFAKIATFLPLDNRSFDEKLLGNPDMLELTPTYRVARETRIKENHLKNVEKIGSSINEVKENINSLTERIHEYVRGNMRGQLDTLMDSLPAKDRLTAQAVFEVAEKYLKPVNVEDMVAKRAKATMQAGIKIKEVTSGMSQEGLDALKKNIISQEGDLNINLEELNKILGIAKPEFRTSVHKAGVEGEVSDAAKKLKEISVVSRKEFIQDNIDEKDLSKFLDEITQHFQTNPSGVNRILDQIIGGKQKLGDLAHEIELDELTFKQSMQDLPGVAKYYVDKSGREFERIRATHAEAASLGVHFESNLALAEIKTSLDVIHATTAKHMLEEISHVGTSKSSAPDTWRPISVKGLKEGDFDLSNFLTGTKQEELVFSPGMASAVEDLLASTFKDESTHELMKKFDKVQNIWKASATSIWPAFHGRNAISNVFLNFLDIGVHALDPTNHVASGAIIAKDHEVSNLMSKLATVTNDTERQVLQNKVYKIQSSPAFTDKSGIVWSHGMLNKVLKDNNIAFNPNATGYVDLTLTREEQMKQIKKNLFPPTDLMGIALHNKNVINPFSQEFGGYKVGRKLGSAIEDQARILNFMTNLKNTGDISLATARTKQFLFDYSNLSDFEKTFMRRVIPFYTWTRKNIELQARTLLTTPGRITTEIHGGKSYGDAFSGGELTEEEKALLPDYMKSQIASGLTFVKSRDGDKVTFASRGQLPLDAALSQAQLNVLFAGTSPLLRVPIEQATGYSFFKDKQIADITNARNYKMAPQALKDFIGYEDVTYTKADGTKGTAEVSLRPDRMNLVDNLPMATKPFTILNNLTNMDLTEGEKALSSMFGMGQSELNLTVLDKQRQAELRSKLIKVLTDAKVGNEFHKFYLTN